MRQQAFQACHGAYFAVFCGYPPLAQTVAPAKDEPAQIGRVSATCSTPRRAAAARCHASELSLSSRRRGEGASRRFARMRECERFARVAIETTPCSANPFRYYMMRLSHCIFLLLATCCSGFAVSSARSMHLLPTAAPSTRVPAAPRRSDRPNRLCSGTRAGQGGRRRARDTGRRRSFGSGPADSRSWPTKAGVYSGPQSSCAYADTRVHSV